jgi:hypothetical protein
MNAPQITNYVSDGLSKLLQQYKGRPLITGMFTAFLEQIQDIENGLYALEPQCQLWNGTTVPAVGAQLDGIGQIVGIPRNGLPDDEYALFLFGKIAENFSQDTVFDVINVAAYLFQAPIMLLQPIYPAGVVVEALGITIPPALWSLAASLVQGALGAGINLVVAGSSFTNAFRFAGPGVTGSVNGFGEGLFVDLIL